MASRLIFSSEFSRIVSVHFSVSPFVIVSNLFLLLLIGSVFLSLY